MKQIYMPAIMFLASACSSGGGALDGNFSGNAAEILDNAANALEGRADNMVAAAEAASANSADAVGNINDSGGNRVEAANK